MLTVKNKKFYLDGNEFEIHCGAFHYFRALPEYWEDILTKFKAAGLNCVETYTCGIYTNLTKVSLIFQECLILKNLFSLQIKWVLKLFYEQVRLYVPNGKMADFRRGF